MVKTLAHYSIALVVILSVAAAPAHAARFEFCWRGNAGYTMYGLMEFPDEYLNTGVITQDQITDFMIEGYHNGEPVGFWSLADRQADTTWILSFDTTSHIFPLGDGVFEVYQGWNANGAVNDCGENGFGFNAGSGGQDVCIDNTFITQSTIDRYTQLKAFPIGQGPACARPRPMS